MQSFQKITKGFDNFPYKYASFSYRIHFQTEFTTGRNFKILSSEFSAVRRSFCNLCRYFDLAVSRDLALREELLSATPDAQVHRILPSGATTALKLSRADKK
jgi:hypothetical protein